MFLAEIAAIRNDLGLRTPCKGSLETTRSVPKMTGNKSKPVILIYYHVRATKHVFSHNLTSLMLYFFAWKRYVWQYNVQWSLKKAIYTKD